MAAKNYLTRCDGRDTQSQIRKRILKLKAESKIDPARNFDAYIRSIAKLSAVTGDFLASPALCNNGRDLR